MNTPPLLPLGVSFQTPGHPVLNLGVFLISSSSPSAPAVSSQSPRSVHSI